MGKASKHPLDPLSADEITLSSQAVRREIAGGQLQQVGAIKFISISLADPPKPDVIRYLGIAISPQDIGRTHPDPSVSIARRAEVSCIDALKGEAYEIIVGLDHHPAIVERVTKLPEGVQPGITNEELCEAEQIVARDPRVIQLCEEVGVKQDQIRADGWSVGYEDRLGKSARLQQCFVYAALDGKDSNFYAHPLDFNVVVDSNKGEVVHIDFAPHRVKDGKLSSKEAITAPPDLALDAFKESGRERIPPAKERFEYLPEFVDFEASTRPPLKPLHVVQPEGVSFHLDGRRLTWQNWDLHVGWSHREGLVLNTLQYNDQGRLRPIIYKMSLSEFVVPYADAAWPHPRKMALDVGEYGLGMMSNSLSLGCDCLGTIHYIDGHYTDHNGNPVTIPSAICIHEEDNGLLWKHADFRENGRAHAVRSRKLVLSMVVSVANYEYAYYINLLQDGTIQQEMKLTGILQLYTLADGEDAGTSGTEVSPRVVAHHHQHLFSTRIDPFIDGINNTVVETSVYADEAPTGSSENYAGNGFGAHKTYLETADKAVRDIDPAAYRTWAVVNENSRHYSSKLPAGFKIMLKDPARLLAKPDSLVAKRTPFSQHSLWVVPDPDGKRLFPAGKYPTQTIVAPADSVSEWAKKGENVRNTDIAIFLTWGLAHVTRPEDYPVMPTETCMMMLKPVNFFKHNPTLDVKSVKDAASKTAFSNGHLNGHANGVNGHANGANGHHANGTCH